MIKIAIMCSTSGTDLQTIVPFLKERKIDAKLQFIFANKQCGAIEKAENYKVKHFVIESKGKTSEEYHTKVKQLMKMYEIDLIVLVGYMKILPPSFIRAFENRIINVHPALLPLFPGAHAIDDALKAGAKETGCTFHFVDEGVDTGPIIHQEKVSVEEGETAATLKAKIQAKEMEYYPKVIQWYVEGKIKIKDGKVEVQE